MLYIFCIAYGIFAGSFTSTWPAVTSEVPKRNPFADMDIVFGFLSLGRGIGNVVSGPLSESLIGGSSTWRSMYGSGYRFFGGVYRCHCFSGGIERGGPAHAMGIASHYLPLCTLYR